ncbi:nostrin isoform X2 [Andrena cerasifolii]|uniref:nostrin isoform X2 n=1 Tax=Andrena cerasifolii TaxID=2819439 RepID=UPI0040383749
MCALSLPRNMEEVRHAWASLKSVRKLSSSNGNSDSSSTTIWYDVPVPVIIHCHAFADVIEADMLKVTAERSTDAMVDASASAGGEQLYQNNEEMLKCRSNDNASSEKSEEAAPEKRHRSTVELTAVTSVKTDEDGLPTISFSFLQADEKLGAGAEDVATDEQQAASPNQLYDFPRNSCVPGEIETETERVVESRGEAEADGNEIHGTIPTELDVVTAAVRDEADHVDEAAGDPSRKSCDTDHEDIAREKADESTAMKIDGLPAERKARYDRAKRSSRSLKSGRKSYNISERDGPGAMSGSYSDPECSNDAGFGASRHRGFPKKHRLGKAWEKMRCWLRDETSRINEVVNKHARLQAVGAISGEAQLAKISKSQSASYDLTKTRTQELGSITRVEEFGLASVLEENATSSPEALGIFVRNAADDLKGDQADFRMIVGSSDNIFDKQSEKRRVAPVSFSMDKLCSDTENEEADNATGEIETKDHARKAGLIKRRMLGSIRGLMASTHLLNVHETEEGGQGGFEDVRRYVKQGGDFCKELASILHERAELEATYAKGLSKLSNKLTKACAKDQGGNSNGGVNEAWRCVGEEMEAAAEAHRVWGITLGEQLAKPLRIGVAEAQGRSRKSIENSVDKAGKSLHEWRNIAMKSKKQSFSSARENERLQDLARLQSISQSQQSNNKSSSHHMTEKEASKLEARRRKAEDSSRRADTEFYTVSVRAERARLEYESTVRKGAKQMELLEEERLSALKDLANVYLAHLQALAPRLQQSADRLAAPVRNCNVSQDIEILKNLIRRVESNDGCNAEQLLPDFYAEHVTLAMNRERRKQALVRVLHLIRQDLERERRGREGLETLHRAFVATPAFAADESTQNVTEKLHHMRSMLLYLEAARYKVGGTLAEVEGSKRGKHPLAEHILVSRDKQGLQQSVLKIPSWAKNESFEFQDDEDEIEVHLTKDHETESRHWADRTAGDGNSENPPDEDDFSDFDEFSSHSEDNNNQDVDNADTASKPDGTEQCRAIYQYSANLNDELSLSPGDLITVHQKQPDGWWIGECRGRTGIFPATYVQVIL